ncbi:sugar transferase [Geoalkalibacter sp.]|uniref:sugar transferase n=1 Tax=Geoalkalibacter sp. TaxID=3041440 RepID=UPI00272E2086|nr:sugar transferase [Geoalkalibacter sp.]
MLKQQASLIRKISIVLDFILLVAALLAAYGVRKQFGDQVTDLRDYLWILLFAFPVWYYLFDRYGLHGSFRQLAPFDLFTRLFNAHVIGTVILAAAIYFIDKDHYSRSLYLLFVLFSFGLLVLVKLGARLLLGRARMLGYNTRNLLIVGTQSKARRFHRLVEHHADWGLKVIGFLRIPEDPRQEQVEEHEVLGAVDDVVAVCKEHPVDEVIFCVPSHYVVDVEAHLRELAEMGVTVRMALDFFDLRKSKRQLGFFHDEIPMLTFHTKSLDAQQLFLKRGLDILGALVGLGILVLLLPFIAYRIKRDSPGPIFFGQERVGENGRIFTCWKFRSMYLDAEERKKELLAQNEMKGAIFKIKDDPRIFPFGHFLRKTSLDELPQFWNVLKGEMSLVGTRPPTPDEVAQYENWQRRRISIKPGITGLWQVSGRNEIQDFDEICRLDLQYIDEWRLWLDIKLLFKTVRVVFVREGSY